MFPENVRVHISFQFVQKSIFVVKNILRKKWVLTTLIVSWFIPLYLQLQNILKYLGKIPQ